MLSVYHKLYYLGSGGFQFVSCACFYLKNCGIEYITPHTDVIIICYETLCNSLLNMIHFVVWNGGIATIFGHFNNLWK